MNPAPPPDAVMMQMLFGKHVAFSLSALARLGVADHMSETLAPVSEIAAASKVHEPSLYRVLRMLASIGLFTQDGRSFGINPVSKLLQTDAPGSLRYMAWMLGDHIPTVSIASLPHSIQTGGDATTKAFGKNYFEAVADYPDELETFQRAMTNFSEIAAAAVLGAYDFTGITRLADVGGGHGTLLSRILGKYPSLHGVLFDLPQIASHAIHGGHFAGCEDRVTVESGTFFERVPAGCDAYIMKHIIHDWSDEHCRKVLTHMRDQLAAHAPSGRVLICEMVVPDSPDPSPAKMLDIEMLVLTVGGKERTASEFTALLASAGLKLERIVPTHSPVCVLEGRLA